MHQLHVRHHSEILPTNWGHIRCNLSSEVSSKNGAKQSRKGYDARRDVILVPVTYVSLSPMAAPTRLQCLDWNGYVCGLKMMVVATMRDREKTALASQATMHDASGLSASVLGTARARESGMRVSGSVL
jgi:hypothetical protein